MSATESGKPWARVVDKGDASGSDPDVMAGDFVLVKSQDIQMDLNVAERTAGYINAAVAPLLEKAQNWDEYMNNVWLVATYKAKADLADDIIEWAREEHHDNFHTQKNRRDICDVCRFIDGYNALTKAGEKENNS